MSSGATRHNLRRPADAGHAVVIEIQIFRLILAELIAIACDAPLHARHFALMDF
jgi:hypothetical protein